MGLEFPQGLTLLNPVPVEEKMITATLGALANNPTLLVGYAPIYDAATADWYGVSGGDDTNGWVFTSLTGSGSTSSNIEVWNPTKPYLAGNTYVSYVNAGSSDPQFTEEALYRCDIDTSAGESPESATTKWTYLGQYITEFYGGNMNVWRYSDSTDATQPSAGMFKIDTVNDRLLIDSNRVVGGQLNRLLESLETGALINLTSTTNPQLYFDIEVSLVDGTPTWGTSIEFSNNWNTGGFTVNDTFSITCIQGASGGAVDSVNGETGVVVLNQDDIADGATYVQYPSTDRDKLANIEAGAEVNNISDIDATDLTDNGDSTLHYHSSDRNRTNHTGTQEGTTVTVDATGFSGNLDNTVTDTQLLAEAVDALTVGGVTLPTFESVTYNGTSYTVIMTENSTVKLNIPDGTTDLTLLFSGASSTDEQIKKLILNNSANSSNVAVITLTGNWESMLGSPVELTDIAANGTITTTLNSDSVVDSIIYSFAQNY